MNYEKVITYTNDLVFKHVFSLKGNYDIHDLSRVIVIPEKRIKEIASSM